MLHETPHFTDRQVFVSIKDEPVMFCVSQFIKRWDDESEATQSTLGDVIKQFRDTDPPTVKSERAMMQLQGHWNGARGAKGAVTGESTPTSPTRWSNLLPIDYDGKDDTDIEQIIKKLRKLPWICGAWKSYSGDGVHAIAVVEPRPRTPKQYREAARTVLDTLHDKIPEHHALLDKPVTLSMKRLLGVPYKNSKAKVKSSVEEPLTIVYDTSAGEGLRRVRTRLANDATIEQWRTLLENPDLRVNDDRFKCPLDHDGKHTTDNSAQLWDGTGQLRLRCFGHHEEEWETKYGSKLLPYSTVLRIMKGEGADPLEDFPVLHQDAQAKLFMRKHGDTTRWVHTLDEWLWFYNGWEKNDRMLVEEQVRDFLHDLSDQEHEARHKRSMNSASSVQSVLRVCKELADYSTVKLNPDQIDADKHLLGVPGGTVNLKTGEIYEPKLNEYVINNTEIYPEQGSHKKFTKFMKELFPDKTVRAYMMRWMGYCLTGETREQCFTVLYGSGGNGKSLVWELLQHLLGDYGSLVDMETFDVDSRRNSEYALAELRGKRFAFTDEPQTSRGIRWNEARLKTLTGNHSITASKKYKDPISFPVTFKLGFSVNRLPGSPEQTDAMKRRLRLIHVDFIPSNPDSGLFNKLCDESNAILWTLIQEAKLWYEEGLPKSKVMEEWSKEYFFESDSIQHFVTECLTEQTAKRDTGVMIARIHDAYVEWKKHNPGAAYYTRREMRRAMERLGYGTRKNHRGEWKILGLKLTESLLERQTKSSKE